MTFVTSEQAREYLDRWRLVHEREVRELRDTSLDTKARQLSVLMSSRDLVRADHDRESGANAVRERWALIRSACRG
jgi:hypothetical protein